MDNITKAKINLFAVLRNLEDLCAMDKESADIIKDTKLSVQFNVPDVGSATIDFDHGKCTFNRGKKHAGLQLFFTSAEHFNNLIDPPKDANGKPKTVIPIFYNVFKVGFLLNQFTKLADRLSYFLQPAADKKEELLKDPEYFKINTTLTLYTALFALCEVANSDKVGKLCAKRMYDGKIAAGIPGGPQHHRQRPQALRSKGCNRRLVGTNVLCEYGIRARLTERQRVEFRRYGQRRLPGKRPSRYAGTNGKDAQPRQRISRIGGNYESRLRTQKDN